jgi:hypothetical protein
MLVFLRNCCALAREPHQSRRHNEADLADELSGVTVGNVVGGLGRHVEIAEVPLHEAVVGWLIGAGQVSNS